jgi:hypothetical protein
LKISRNENKKYLNCLKPTPSFLSHSALFTLINKDGKQIQYLYNPTVGKIVSFLIGIAVIWMLIKAIQKNLFLKLRTIIIGIKHSVVSLVIF